MQAAHLARGTTEVSFKDCQAAPKANQRNLLCLLLMPALLQHDPCSGRRDKSSEASLLLVCNNKKVNNQNKIYIIIATNYAS